MGTSELHEGLNTCTAVIKTTVNGFSSSGPGHELPSRQNVGPADSRCVAGQVRREKGQSSLDAFVRRPPGSEAQSEEKACGQEEAAEDDESGPGKSCTCGASGSETSLIKG